MSEIELDRINRVSYLSNDHSPDMKQEIQAAAFNEDDFVET